MTRILVTGSSGHLGEGLMRTLAERSDVDAVGLDVKPSPWTQLVGSITDRSLVRRALAGVDAVLHTATLHKPHVASHSRQDFVDTNVSGTLVLLEEAAGAGVGAFVFTSSTTTFGRANHPPPGAPAAWITEDVVPLPKNIYGVTKVAAENVCELVHRDQGLPVLILRTSRFFPESDDRDDVRPEYEDLNLKVNELLYRRLDLADAVDVHLLALGQAAAIGFGRYIVSATTPFDRGDAAELGHDAAAVVRRHFPDIDDVFGTRGWKLLPALDRVYDNARARSVFGWSPRYGFRAALDALGAGEDPRSPLARAVGAKGYHERSFGVYTSR